MADTYGLPITNDDQPFMDAADKQVQLEIDNQRGVIDDLKSGFNQTALAAGINRAGDEGTAAVEAYNEANPEDRAESKYGRPGMTTGQMGAALGGIAKGLTGRSFGEEDDTDNEANFDELTADIPRAYHADILNERTLDGQTRTRARILEQLEAQRISAIQWDGGGLELIGSLIEADIPLMFATGGMIGAAKVANLAKRVTPTGRGTGLAQGLVGGAQSGLIVGSYDLMTRETADETSFVASVIGGAALGGAFGSIGGDMSKTFHDLELDYARRVETNDPSLTATNDVAEGSTPDKPFDQELADLEAAMTAEAGPSTAGATEIRMKDDGRAPKRPLVDEAEMSEASRTIVDHAHADTHTTGFNDRRAEQTGWLDQIASSSWNGAVGANFQAKMYTSKSSVMNWMGYRVFENASGLNRGTDTAAGLMENYHKRIQTQLLPVTAAMDGWAKRNDTTAFSSGYGTSNKGRAAFNREVMLERNARNMGLSRSTDEDIIRAADAYDSAARDSLSISKGRDDQHSVKGMEDIKDNPHYNPLNWNGAKIASLIKSGRVTRANIIEAIAEGYRSAGMAAGKDANAVAEAVIRRTEVNAAEMDSSVHSLLQADGKDFLEDALYKSTMSKAEVDGLMTRLGLAAENRGKEGFAKSRNDIDLNGDILTEAAGATDSVKIVDLLSNDLDGDWQRYTRRVAGASALARQGITNRAARNDIINAIHAEQRALGEDITPTDELASMFTHFDGGAIQGWGELVSGGGLQTAGAGASMLKRMVQLAWLNKMGLTQLGETGAMMAQNGMASWMKRGPFANFNAELKQGNAELLKDISFITGDIGMDHKLFKQHLDLDEVSDLDSPDYISKINSKLATASFIQSYTSLFNTVRSSQQQTAALGVMDKVMRTLRDAQTAGNDLTDAQKARLWSDLGLDGETLNRLDGLINSGVIEFSPEGFVNRLNADKWDGDLQDIVGVSITRNINQVVQKSMAGEQDAWMHTSIGSILSHLKTFPLQATHKQFIRHFRHNDVEAYATTMATLGTALIASMVREGVDQAGGKDKEWMGAGDHAKRAFLYSNMLGFIPMGVDPLMTIIGADDLRFNQYGNHAEIAPPILSFANDAMRLPGALFNAVTGNADGSDKRALRTVPFANTILIGEMFQTIGQKG